MKSSHIFLIIGAGLFIAGLVVFSVTAFTVVKEVLRGSALINGTTLGPGEATAVVMKNVPAAQRLALALQEDPIDAPLRAQITGPDGKVLTLATINATGSRYTATTTTTVAGDQTLEIKNNGTRSVSISGALVNIPFGQGQMGGSNAINTPQVQQYVAAGIGILAGIVITIAGIVMLIIGAVKYFRERGAARAAASSSN